MKTLFTTVAALALVGFAAPALADTTAPSTTTFTINAANPAKCQVNADSTTVTLANDSISNEQGRAQNHIGREVARGLNDLGVKAWCTGASNGVVLSRTALATGNGEAVDGFNSAVIYDLTVDIADATRVDGFRPIEGTSDGAGNGPGAGTGTGTPVGHFGPTGQGSRLHFAEESASDAVTSGAPGQGPRSSYSANDARLIAGAYTGEVVLTVTPGN